MLKRIFTVPVPLAIGISVDQKKSRKNGHDSGGFPYERFRPLPHFRSNMDFVAEKTWACNL
jgi:hypothetical protein